MTEEHRDFTTRRLLDPLGNPPRYVDEELPVRTVKLQGAERKVYQRSPAGTSVGSFRLSGSFYETAMGSNSLRVTRLSLGVTGPGFLGQGTPSALGLGTTYRWHIRHSRDGTTDIKLFHDSGRIEERGDGMAPLYSFGPGTIEWGFLGDHLGQVGTQVSFVQSMEGLLG
jgi:hypothetical protein